MWKMVSFYCRYLFKRDKSRGSDGDAFVSPERKKGKETGEKKKGSNV